LSILRLVPSIDNIYAQQHLPLQSFFVFSSFFDKSEQQDHIRWRIAIVASKQNKS
jgi:hypothetical protein